MEIRVYDGTTTAILVVTIRRVDDETNATWGIPLWHGAYRHDRWNRFSPVITVAQYIHVDYAA
ncbi:binding-protein-dependent transport systems inner membrane component [Alicyclobacillus hesperidum URH17-3-68]|nr:binding-protein-dependent transport systems inner membrane component [Alicyclobacillus hesperidum URH17-3-68]